MLNPDKKYGRRAITKAKVTFRGDDPTVELVHADVDAKTEIHAVELYEYECEVCGKKERLAEEDAYENGWDYPPFIGMWRVVSPRTCPSCPMTETAWWHLINNGGDEMPEKHLLTVQRILAETPPEEKVPLDQDEREK